LFIWRETDDWFCALTKVVIMNGYEMDVRKSPPPLSPVLPKPYLTGNPWAVYINEEKDEGKKQRVASPQV
jgi:hypothetical protein